MLFILDPSKPAQEVIFSRKKASLCSSDYKSKYYSIWKNVLSRKTRCIHIDGAISKISKGISVFKNFGHGLPQAFN